MEIRWFRIITVSALLTITLGCKSYRYSTRIFSPPPTAMHFGSFSVKEISFDNGRGYPLNLIREKELLDSLGESSNSFMDCTPIKVNLRIDRFVSSNDNGDLAGLLHHITFGILPVTTEKVIDIDVSVQSDQINNHSHDFKIRFEERTRFTPLGLWPFIGEDSRDECYAAICCLGQEKSTSLFNRVLGTTILSGLTSNFTKGIEK